MKDYDFTLKFSLSSSSIDPEVYVEKLIANGCDDALIGIGQKGRIALDFTREAKSAFDAVLSALRNVKQAIPKAKLVEATPDLVGLTDVADMLGFSRQYMRKIRINNEGLFPAPVHEGKSAIWHLSKILLWLKENSRYSIEDSLIEISKVNMQCNLVKEQLDVTKDLGEVNQNNHRSLRALIA